VALSLMKREKKEEEIVSPMGNDFSVASRN
jgi:hypothetical protein